MRIRELLWAFFESYIFIILFAMGLVILLSGLAVSAYGRDYSYAIKMRFSVRPGLWSRILDKAMSAPLLKQMKESVKNNLVFSILDEKKLNSVSNLFVLGILILSAANMVLLRNVGQLWYVKVMILSISFILPYYVLMLLFDLHKYSINRHIPKLIDEFWSAFIKHKKVRPALKESSAFVNRRLGRVMEEAADSTFTEEKLEACRDKFNNIWFNMFVVLLVNFKENGGDLIGQLYRLNSTMTTNNNIEKKKNRRLILYELFAIAASILSIPAVLWLNSALLGESAKLVDPQSNIIISRVIAYSVLSLIIIRVLRKS